MLNTLQKNTTFPPHQLFVVADNASMKLIGTYDQCLMWLSNLPINLVEKHGLRIEELKRVRTAGSC